MASGPDISPLSSKKSHTQTTFFHKAQDVKMTNSSIFNVQGDYYTTDVTLTGLSSLRQQISDSAMFDSGARYASGRCHPGTRSHIIETIMEWINDPSPPKSVLWLHGSAGIGKSSIMQTISETLAECGKGLYAASFFFVHGLGEERGESWSSLFPTLAYQIAVNFPKIGLLINREMDLDHTLPTKSLSVQMKSLLVKPMKEAAPEMVHKHPPTVLIDGLDECRDSEMHCKLLNLISEALTVYNIPLRFVIASRPEYWIKNVFEHGSLQSNTKQVSLNDQDYAPITTVNSDMAMFLRDSFDAIYFKHSDVMADVKRPWPSPDIIDRLVYEASGQFIYASTIIKFVGYSSDFCDPVKQLDVVVSSSLPSRSVAFSELDRLYSRILSVHPRPKSMKMVLGGILLRLRPLYIQRLFGVERAELIITLNCLSSVVDKSDQIHEGVDEEVFSLFSPPESRTVVKFSHKSFGEYLLDKSRSGPFWIDLDPLRENIANILFKSIRTSLQVQHTGEEVHDKHYYHSITRVLIDWKDGRNTLLPLLRDMKQGLDQYINSTNAQISRPASLIRSLKCIQQLTVGRNFISEFHDFATYTLTQDVYAKIVAFLYSSGLLKITNNLIYFSVPISDLESLQNLSSELGHGDDVSPKEFLLQNRGIINVWNFTPSAGSPNTASYLLEPCVRDSLVNRFDNIHRAYRVRYISVALRSLEYILQTYNQQMADNQRIEPEAPWKIFLSFLDTPQLSDVEDKEDLQNTDLVSFINLIMDIDTSGPISNNRPYRDYHWRSVNDWRSRQQKDPTTMAILREFLPSLAEKISTSVDHTLGPLGLASNFGFSKKVLRASGILKPPIR